MEVLREAKASGVVVEEVSWARLAQLCGGAVHQGIVLQTAAASSVTLKDLLARCEQSPESPLLVAVDGITDPHNLGAIARSAEAFGGHGLVAPQRRNAGLTGSVAKVAAGALEHLPVARVVNLNRSLEQLKDAGYTVVGLAGEGGQSVVEIPAGEPLVVVVGSEGSGLSHLTRQYCHQIVRIPLRGKTPHLNASVACGVVLYEIARQRWLGEIHGSMPTPPAPDRRPPTVEQSEPELTPVPTTDVEPLTQQAVAPTDPVPTDLVDDLVDGDGGDDRVDNDPQFAAIDPEPGADFTDAPVDAPTDDPVDLVDLVDGDDGDGDGDGGDDGGDDRVDNDPQFAAIDPEPDADFTDAPVDAPTDDPTDDPVDLVDGDDSDYGGDGSDLGDDNPAESAAPQLDEPTPAALPVPAQTSQSPDLTWSSSAADTDDRLAAHVVL